MFGHVKQLLYRFLIMAIPIRYGIVFKRNRNKSFATQIKGSSYSTFNEPLGALHIQPVVCLTGGVARICKWCGRQLYGKRVTCSRHVTCPVGIYCFVAQPFQSKLGYAYV